MAQSLTNPGDLPAREAEPRPARGSRRKRWLLTGLAVLLLLGVLVGIKAAQIVTMIKTGKSFVPPPEAVGSAKAEEVEWPVSRTAVGSVVAVRGAMLGAELPGVLREITFESGTLVKKGQLLVRLDTTTEQAQVQGALTDAALAESQVERVRVLASQGASSRVELDTAEARVKQARSSLATARAVLAKKSIRAPFEGRVGIRQVELGQMVSPGTPIVSLQSMDPIYVEFQLPQQSLAGLELGQEVKVLVDAFPDAHWAGKVTTINPEVDPATRNVRIRATVPNPDGHLSPGMFANIDLLSGRQNKVISIPATSVIFAPFGDSVFVLEKGQDKEGNPATVVRQRFIRIGERRGDFVAVTSGLKPGEELVSSGAFKLRNGSTVKVDNNQKNAPSLAPTPPES